MALQDFLSDDQDKTHRELALKHLTTGNDGLATIHALLAIEDRLDAIASNVGRPSGVSTRRRKIKDYEDGQA